MFKVLIVSLLFISSGSIHGRDNAVAGDVLLQNNVFDTKDLNKASRMNYSVGVGFFGGFASFDAAFTGIETLHVFSGYNTYEHNALLKIGMGIGIFTADTKLDMHPSVSLGIGYMWLIENIRNLNRLGIGITLDTDIFFAADASYIDFTVGPSIYVVLNKTFLSIGMQYNSLAASVQGKISLGVFISLDVKSNNN